MSSKSGPTFYQSLAAGGAAGTSVDLLFYPIDTIKTRLQSTQGFTRAGGFSGVYKGVGSVVVGSAPGAATFFATYDTLKRTLPMSGPALHITAASAAEIVSEGPYPARIALFKAACLIRVPTEVIKTRMQTSSYGNLAQGSFAAAKLVWKSHGLRGFYRGYSMTIMREIPFTSIQFPLYEAMKARWSAYSGKRPLPAGEAAICGSIAGGIAAAATTPLDVLKTRIMLDVRSSTQNMPSIASRLSDIWFKEGPKALFAGIVPRTMWISAGGAVFLGVYEWTVNGLMIVT